MTSVLKRNIFITLGLALVMILVEVFLHIEYLVFFAVGLLLMVLSLFLHPKSVRFLVLGIASFCTLVALFATRSVWLALILGLVMILIFRTDEGNQLFHLDSAYLKPFDKMPSYHPIQIVEDQMDQVDLLQQVSILETANESQLFQNLDDINLVYIGGHDIIDLGKAKIPNQETIVMVRKVFGTTRIILPKGLSFSMNISLVKGGVQFEREKYPLLNENFRWQGPNYQNDQRKVKLVVSQAFGNVEVILI